MQEIRFSSQTPSFVATKIVATPTLYSWSQAYNAGTLFAVASLQTTSEQKSEESLYTIGKAIIKNLEAEYFSLEKKDLTALETVAKVACTDVSENITVCLVIATVIQTILYSTAIGGGKVLLKRGGTIGEILTTEEGKQQSTSGFLEEGDIIVLETEQFATLLPEGRVRHVLSEYPKDSTEEELTVLIRENDADAAGALIVTYQKQEQKEILTATPTETEEQAQEDPTTSIETPEIAQEYVPSRTRNARKLPKLPSFKKFLSRKSLFFLVIIGILIILGISITRTIQQKSQVKNQKAFQAFFPQAQQLYDEGQSLLSLNKNLASDDFEKAQTMLETGSKTLDPTSSEYKQTQDLLKETNDALTSSSEKHDLQASQASDSDSKLLSLYTQNSDTKYVATDGTNFFRATDTGIFNNDKQIVKKNWTSMQGIGAYGGNVYVLDPQANQIEKLSATDNGYVKSNYLSVDESLTNAKAIAIDGSVYMLMGDGTIQKFTRGTTDSFTIKGLDKPLTGATKLFTTTDATSLYVLDPENSRVVAFGKDGTYAAQYSASVLKDAKDLDVDEKDKTIIVLSDNKLFKLSF